MDNQIKSDYREKKKLISAFILVTIGIIFLCTLYLLNYRQSFRDETGKQLESIAVLKMSELVQWRKERLGDASLFLNNRNFSELALRYINNPADNDARDRLLIWMNKICGSYSYSSLGIYDFRFRKYLVYPENEESESAVFFDTSIKDLKAGKIVFKDFYRDEHDKKIYLMILVPLFDSFPGGRFNGVLAMRIDPESHLYPFIRHWPIPSSSAETLLVRREGEYALFLNELRFEKNSALNFRIPVTREEVPAVKGALGREGIEEGIDYRGERVIAAVKNIPDSPWAIVARIDKSEVDAPLIVRLLTVIFVAVSFISGSGTLLMLYRKQQNIQIYRKNLATVEMLRISEKDKLLFSNALEQSLNEIYIFDTESFKFKTVNKGGRENTGYSIEELFNMTPVDLNTDFTEEQLKELIKPLLDGKESIVTFFTVFMRKNASTYPVEVHLSINRDEKLFIATVIDITGSKQIIKALEENELLFRTLIDTIPDLIWLKDPDGVYIVCNPMFERFFGAKISDIIGKTDYDFVDKEAADFFREKDKTAMEAGGPTGNEEWVTFADDGHSALLDTVKTPMIDKNGSFIGVLGIARDITGRKKAEDALRASEERYRLIFENINDAFFLTGPDGSILTVNPAGCRMFGRTEQDICTIGRNSVMDPSDPRFEQALEFRSKNGFFEGELTGVRSDGTKFPIAVSSLKFIDSNGKPGTSVIIRDITRQKEYEYELKKFNADLENRVADRTADLKKANKELESFSYSVSHDLRAPLRHIAGFLEMLKKEMGDTSGEKVNHYMEVISDSSKRMGQLIDDLLSFSRMKRASFSKQNVNMELLADEVFKEYSEETGMCKISFTRHPLPDIKGDRAMLRVVFNNLISNAIKFTGKTVNPEIEIGCKTTDNGNEFYVRDNGAGFDMHYADKLFGVFQRLHSDQEFKGTGIGLAMVKSIIERHSGRVWAESEPGKGTCFYFVLPSIISETE